MMIGISLSITRAGQTSTYTVVDVGLNVETASGDEALNVETASGDEALNIEVRE